MNDEQLYERIEAYLSGDMPPEEAEAFRKEMEANPALEAEVALHRGIAEAVEEEEEVEDLENKVGAIMKRGPEKVQRPIPRRRFLSGPILRLAAAVALLVITALAAYVYFTSNPGGNTTETLFAEYMAYPESLYEGQAVRSTEPDAEPEAGLARLDSLWRRADALYQAGQFELALAVLEEVETRERQLFSQPSSRLHYYRGILLALTEQYRAAIASFEQVKASYTEEAAWKRAVTMLRVEGRREGAIRAVREIANSNTPRRGKAQELLKELGVEVQ